MQIVIDISKDRYDEIMSMDWKNCRRFFDEEIRAIHDGKALAQEPCDDVPDINVGKIDAISRQAVLDHIYGINGLEGLELSNVFEKHYANFIRSLPPVTPQPKMGRWIPVSERLPEWGVSVLVYAERNAYDDKGQFRRKVIDIGWQCGGDWHIDGCNGVVGIAWMPLPEPYKQEVEE